MLSCLTGMYGRCVGCLGRHQGFTTHKHANSLNHALFVWNSCCSQSMLMIWLLHNELSWIKQYLNVRNVSVLLRAASVGKQRYKTQLRFFSFPTQTGHLSPNKGKKRRTNTSVFVLLWVLPANLDIIAAILPPAVFCFPLVQVVIFNCNRNKTQENIETFQWIFCVVIS